MSIDLEAMDLDAPFTLEGQIKAVKEGQSNEIVVRIDDCTLEELLEIFSLDQLTKLEISIGSFLGNLR